MKILKTIYEKDIFPEREIKTDLNYRLREAVRAILIDTDGKIAILATDDNFYKIPGGGVESGESIKSALIREIKEETGCRAEILDELGQINEYRDEYELFQKSYCFIAEVRGEKGIPQFTIKENDEGFELEWFEVDYAEKVMSESNPRGYEGKFIAVREKAFLDEFIRTRKK